VARRAWEATVFLVRGNELNRGTRELELKTFRLGQREGDGPLHRFEVRLHVDPSTPCV
jgi:hypothetical protein